jgi:hypothetical protein
LIFSLETIFKFGDLSSSNKGSTSSKFADGAIVLFLHVMMAKIVSATPFEFI